MNQSTPSGAVVTKLSVPRRYRAWCEPCQDGVQGGKPRATNWAEAHNQTRHPQEETPEATEVPC